MSIAALTPRQIYETRWDRLLFLPLSEIAAMSFLDFLGGTGTPEEEVEIDEAYGTRSLEEVAAEWSVIDRSGILSRWDEAAYTVIPSRIDPAYGHAIYCGDLVMVERATGRVAGGVMGTDVIVAPELQRRGFGNELVGRFLALAGRMPIWSTSPCFSPDGYALRRRVHDKLQDPAWRAALEQDVAPLLHHLHRRGTFVTVADGGWVPAGTVPDPTTPAP